MIDSDNADNSSENGEDNNNEEESYEGSLNSVGEYHGRGTVYFDADKKDKFQGRFCNGVKQGKGSFYFSDGSSLSGNFVDDCLEGRGLYMYEDGSLMVGTYEKGVLNGYSEEYDAEGRLTFEGNYVDNIRSGICQFYFEFGGQLFGVVDKEGKLSGKDVIYAYPDEKHFLKGIFKDGAMISACEAVYSGIGDKTNPHSYKKLNNTNVQFCKDVSTKDNISTHPLQPDPYEQKRVTVNKSIIADANEGLFSLIAAGPEEVMSFYNGIRISHFKVDERDWKYNDNTISLDEKIVIDVPSKWSNISLYCASLGHKANHSFNPNCKYDKYHHPRFGFIKCIRTITKVKAGDELTVLYGYDHTKLDTDAPNWYREKLKIWKEKIQPT